MKTRKVTFAARPENLPQPSTFAIVEEDLGAPAPGLVAVRVD